MPTPQSNSLFVEQASCLFLRIKFIICGTGILPVLKNGAKCELLGSSSHALFPMPYF
jgi:hypothetical protein